jgi:hypothetical protein
MLFISAVFSIVKLNHATAQKYVCDSYTQEVTYNGILPDSISSDESLTGFDDIRCCLRCLNDRPHCVGVLHNQEQKKCLLLKRGMEITNNGGQDTLGDWRYFKMRGW